VNGVKYKAFIIEGESWTKSKMEVSYESANEEVNKQQQEFAEKLETKNQKFMIRKGFTNRHGYMVMPSTTWFVPQLGGSVKSISYDIVGGISTIMQTEGLQ